jgi:hypothetical protein
MLISEMQVLKTLLFNNSKHHIKQVIQEKEQVPYKQCILQLMVIRISHSLQVNHKMINRN